MSTSRTIRVGCVQFSPIFKDVKASIEVVDELISPVFPGQLDLLVLPEMAFTGYCFESSKDIEPWLEESNSGPTFQWAHSIAIRLGCYVLVGFPERTVANQAYNSLLIVSPAGELVETYRKHFLYETDESWATEGTSFTTLDLTFPESSPHRGQAFRICPCICMDLNPRGFIAPFDAFELATFADKNLADIVICSMNWLDSDQDDDAVEGGDDWDQVARTLSYFALRLNPLTGKGTAFIGCNRVGKEIVAFTGSSVLMQLYDRPTVISFASKRRPKLLLGDLTLPSRAV